MDNGGGSSNLSSSNGGSTASIAGQLHLQQHHQLPPNSMTVSTPTSEQQEATALKKALEWELSLDAKDLRSHAWYHGPLSRQRAEEIVQREGEFLIRDCGSQPDNYVLTCHIKTQVLHFVINKVSERGIRAGKWAQRTCCPKWNTLERCFIPVIPTELKTRDFSAYRNYNCLNFSAVLDQLLIIHRFVTP